MLGSLLAKPKERIKRCLNLIEESRMSWVLLSQNLTTSSIPFMAVWVQGNLRRFYNSKTKNIIKAYCFTWGGGYQGSQRT